MKLFFQYPAFPVVEAAATATLEVTAIPSQKGENSIRIHASEMRNDDRLRIFLERDGVCVEFVSKVTASQSHGMLIGAISCALNVSGEIASSLDADQRRVVGLLILNSDSLTSVSDLAYNLSGSFRGVTNDYVAAIIEGIRKRFGEAKVGITILGSIESSFRIQSK